MRSKHFRAEKDLKRSHARRVDLARSIPDRILSERGDVMRSLLTFFFISLIFITSCGGGSEVAIQDGSSSAPEFARTSEDPGDAGARQAPESSRSVSLDTSLQTSPTARKVIRNAELTLESDDPEKTQKQVSAIAESKGGFVTETQQSSSDRRGTARDTILVSLRVPADKFAETVEETRRTAGRVVFENIKGQDVTEEFIDIEARLKAHRALEDQFLEIMKRANTVADALNVQRELANVRAEIEKIEGRKRFLEDQVSLSTIKLRIQTPAAISASGADFGQRLVEAVSTGFDAALGFVLGMVTVVIALIPFLVFICLPILLVLRYFWKRLKRRRTAAAIIKDELVEVSE